MKKVKELKKWIELYGEVHAAAEELELAYEYVKEEIITEEEVDAAYKKALHLLEDLEFRNMLRDEADQMSCVLKINSGAGGTESQDWASMLMRMYQRWAENNGYKISIENTRQLVENVGHDIADAQHCGERHGKRHRDVSTAFHMPAVYSDNMCIGQSS